MKNIFKDKEVIVRSNMAGVFHGTLKSKTESEVHLTNVRKLYFWSGANTVEDIAVSGVKNPEDCKFTVIVDSMIIKDYCQILIASEKCNKSIKKVKIWKYR